MNNGEVKRWMIPNRKDDFGFHIAIEKDSFMDEHGYGGCTEVMPVEDHERIVAEKDADIARITSQYQASSIEWGQTIAKQKRVIEKLKEQRDIELEDNCWDDVLTGGRPFEQTRATMNAEIAAIEKGEK